MNRLFGPSKPKSKPSQDVTAELRNAPEEPERSLTSMIGYLSATKLEDWSFVLEVCDRASLNEANAKEAVKALRSEFKYGQPHAQLAAAKLWAIMLRSSTDTFISQSRQRKFLDALEEVIKSGRTTPVVTDRLLEIIAAAAYTSGRHTTENGSEKDGFRGLWLRVKPDDKPDEGIPFDSEDAMFRPPLARTSTYENGAIVPAIALQQASPLPAENFAPVRHKPAGTRNRIIPHDEDIRRLFQECRMAVGNATLLSEALLTCTPSSLKNNAFIKEFHQKCESSQKLVFAQIEWATAQAEQSRVKRNAEREQRGEDGDDETIEEQLLGALLGANEELLYALRQHDDLLFLLRQDEDLFQIKKQSRKDIRMDPREIVQHQQQAEHLPVAHGVDASRSRSPSPARSVSGSPPSHGGHGSNVGHSHSQSYQGTLGVVGVYTTHQGSHTNVNQPTQPHGQQGTVYANAPYTDQGHGQTNTNQYRSPPEHSIPSLPPPLKAPFGPRAPSNFSLRSRPPYPNRNSRPNDDFSNNAQYSQVDGGHHGGASSIVLTHTETDGGSYGDHAVNGQQQGTELDSPPRGPPEELIESGQSSPVLNDQLLATVESGRTTPILTDQLPAIVAATSDSMSVCLYPSGIADSQLECREDQCLFPTGDRDLDRFFGIPSVAGEESGAINDGRSLQTRHSNLDQPDVSSKVVAVLNEASCVEISGGVFNNAGNDIHNYLTDQQVHYYSTTLPPSPAQKGSGKEWKHIWQMALLYVGLGVAIGVIPTAILKWIGR
ncbi:hypothetical protein BKA70DRAFT_1398023 [Coprinopsis sp. MPI-PUGE-AT-0042]|nr:hypothetical protein BKA70DRAFT_1398023 [Coprinopsis sp. MPI-PUGE-AT-0042]